MLKAEHGLCKALGLCWQKEDDKLVYRVKLNFGKKSRNRYDEKDTTKESL